jgi:hypothetical protein
MKRLVALVLAGVGLALSGMSAETLRPSGLVKVFTGGNGEKVSVVYLEPYKRNRVLIKFEGVTGDWEGKIIMHTRENRPGVDDYRAFIDGEPYVSLVGRARGGTMRYELYAPGLASGPVAVTYNAEESKKTLGSRVVYEFTAPAE